GQYTSPHQPHHTYPGHFRGEFLHVYDYYDILKPVDLRGKRVIVVGLGTSAAELAAELANPDTKEGCAGQVILSARSGRWVVPKLAEGPMDSSTPHISVPPPSFLRVLPPGVSNWLTRRMMGKGMRQFVSSYGGASALGLPEPVLKPWEERPTLSFDFIPMLKAGRIDVRAGIERFDDTTVYFSDGSHTEADVILYATGYDLHFPFLNADTLGVNANDLSLYRHISHCEHDNLFFIGYCRVMCALWPVAEQQSLWLARLLTGQFILPDANKRRRRGVSLRRSLPVMCSLYVEALRKDAGG
ncbi:MAG: hypothetical protein O3A63_14220, partial [Proteobacteria bacterium]|nr:hypothetical protein [Pseudomonadota bacterium]